MDTYTQNITKLQQDIEKIKTKLYNIHKDIIQMLEKQINIPDQQADYQIKTIQKNSHDIRKHAQTLTQLINEITQTFKLHQQIHGLENFNAQTELHELSKTLYNLSSLLVRMERNNNLKIQNLQEIREFQINNPNK